MIYLFFFILILLIPHYSEAAFKIYLKNGSIISGASSYQKKAGEVIIYFGGGSIGISEKDIVKIEETGAPEKDFRSKELPGAETREEAPAALPQGAAGDKSSRISQLRSELEALNSEISTVEEKEANLVLTINEKWGTRYKYSASRVRFLEREIEPLRQELFVTQQKKEELKEKRALIEGELRALQ
ncbi:MAG: hypothetical protein AB1638_04535 [Nitrospirota bacterium]